MLFDVVLIIIFKIFFIEKYIKIIFILFFKIVISQNNMKI